MIAAIIEISLDRQSAEDFDALKGESVRKVR
jgi:hypothetical protein